MPIFRVSRPASAGLVLVAAFTVCAVSVMGQGPFPMAPQEPNPRTIEQLDRHFAEHQAVFDDLSAVHRKGALPYHDSQAKTPSAKRFRSVQAGLMAMGWMAAYREYGSGTKPLKVATLKERGRGPIANLWTSPYSKEAQILALARKHTPTLIKHPERVIQKAERGWLVQVRAIRSSSRACATCHTGAKIGDALGVVVYTARRRGPFR